MPVPRIVFDEDADHLAVADVDVVRPLDARVDAELVEAVRQGQRHQFDEAELLDDGQERRREDVREGEALLRAADPGVAALSAAGGLPLGPDDVVVAVLGPLGVVVGRGGLFDAVNHA